MAQMILYQSKTGYRYNSDSLFLYDFALRFTNFKGGALLDVGCGCGILGLLLARDFRDFAFSLTSIDISPLNTTITAKNAKLNAIKSQIICADFISWASEFCGQKFSLIISNPPFYNFGFESANSHRNLARENKNMDLNDFIKSCSRLLLPKGKLVFCYDVRFLDMIISALNANKLKLNKMRLIYPKEQKSAKTALFLCAKNSRSPCEIIAPLYANLNEILSDEAKEIYKKAGLKSIDFD